MPICRCYAVAMPLPLRHAIAAMLLPLFYDAARHCRYVAADFERYFIYYADAALRHYAAIFVMLRLSILFFMPPCCR